MTIGKIGYICHLDLNVFNVAGNIAFKSKKKKTSYKSMCTELTISYIVMAMCFYPLAVGGFWAYGNKASGFSFFELNESCYIHI